MSTALYCTYAVTRNMYQLHSVPTDPARITYVPVSPSGWMDLQCHAEQTVGAGQPTRIAPELQRVHVFVSTRDGAAAYCVLCVCVPQLWRTDFGVARRLTSLDPSSNIDTSLPPMMRAQCAAATALVSCLSV